MRPVARKYDETGEWAVDVYKAAWDQGRFARSILELGGNNAAIITDKADVALALRGVLLDRKSVV